MRLAPALMFFALAAHGAEAADYLRGPISAEAPKAQSTTWDWSGTYVGLQGIWNNANIDQAALANRVGTAAFPNTGVQNNAGSLLYFGRSHVNGMGIGGFAGYNMQWDDVVLGVELDYNRGGLKATSVSAPLGRALSGSGSATRLWDTVLSGRAETRVQDVTTLKLRVGAAFDRFLPFVSGGVLIGRASSQASTAGQTQEYEMQPILDPVTSQIIGYTRINISGILPGSAQVKDQGFRWGYHVGAGVDVAITENFFLRGAWEYNQFGTGGARTTINAFKGGAAVKF